jgi:hypothetical protein
LGSVPHESDSWEGIGVFWNNDVIDKASAVKITMMAKTTRNRRRFKMTIAFSELT